MRKIWNAIMASLLAGLIAAVLVDSTPDHPLGIGALVFAAVFNAIAALRP